MPRQVDSRQRAKLDHPGGGLLFAGDPQATARGRIAFEEVRDLSPYGGNVASEAVACAALGGPPLAFPKRRKAIVPSVEIATEIERRKSALADAQSRLADAERRHATAFEAFDAAGMTAAETDMIGIRNELKVAERAVGVLAAEHSVAVAREADEALTERRAAAERRLVEAAPKLLAEYDRLAAPLAAVLAALNEIDGETSQVNEQLLRAKRSAETLDGLNRRYRCEIGVQEPDRVETFEEWQEQDPDGSWSRVLQLVPDGAGAMVPRRHGARKVQREICHPVKRHWNGTPDRLPIGL